MGIYLVTGGAGFIGSHLVEGLAARGERVRILDDLSTGREANLAGVRGRPAVEFVHGDIRDPAVVRAAVQGAEVVFHHAAMASVPRSIADPMTAHAVNLDGTLNILSAARQAGVRRVVFAASSSAYGDDPESPKTESMVPRPISPYAAGKLAAEHYCRVFAGVYGLDTVSLRYFNVFGPRQDPAGPYAAAIPLFAAALLRGEPPTIYGDGGQTRDFTYIDNVVHANLLAAAAPGRLGGEAVNIACGTAVTINEVVDRLNVLLGTRVAPRHLPERPGDIRHSLADVSLAGRLLGYQPKVTFAEGLRRAMDWYRASLSG